MKREWFTKGILIGAGITAGIVGSLALAVTVGTVKTWTTGETLTAADLNSTVTSLKTALEAIPNWTKSGTSAVYTDGNVGIGTNSPIMPLHLEHSGSNTQAFTLGGSTNGVADPNLNTGIYARTNAIFDINTAGTGTITLSPGGSEKVRLTNTGNVGIGTTTPGVRLYIQGGDEQIIANSDGGASTLYLRNTVDANKGALTANTGLDVTTGGANDILLRPGGNVGIGTTTPDALLDVISGGANGTAHGAWGSHSSRTIKKDIEYLDTEDQQEMLEKFLKTPLARFRYKNEPKSARPHLGLIAEESPQEVLQEGHDAVMLMDYVTFLAASVKAQQEQIEKLKAKIESLESLSK